MTQPAGMISPVDSGMGMLSQPSDPPDGEITLQGVHQEVRALKGTLDRVISMLAVLDKKISTQNGAPPQQQQHLQHQTPRAKEGPQHQTPRGQANQIPPPHPASSSQPNTPQPECLSALSGSLNVAMPLRLNQSRFRDRDARRLRALAAFESDRGPNTPLTKGTGTIPHRLQDLKKSSFRASTATMFEGHMPLRQQIELSIQKDHASAASLSCSGFLLNPLSPRQRRARPQESDASQRSPSPEAEEARLLGIGMDSPTSKLSASAAMRRDLNGLRRNPSPPYLVDESQFGSLMFDASVNGVELRERESKISRDTTQKDSDAEAPPRDAKATKDTLPGTPPSTRAVLVGAHPRDSPVSRDRDPIVPVAAVQRNSNKSLNTAPKSDEGATSPTTSADREKSMVLSPLSDDFARGGATAYNDRNGSDDGEDNDDEGTGADGHDCDDADDDEGDGDSDGDDADPPPPKERTVSVDASARFEAGCRKIRPIIALRKQTRDMQRKSLSAAFHDRTQNPIVPVDADSDVHTRTVYLPNERHRIIFDTVAYVSILVESFWAIYAFVTSDAPSLAYIIVTLLFLPVFPVFVWYNLRTMMVAGWTLVECPQEIQTKYFKSFFACDVVLSVPWDLLLSLADRTAFRVGLLVRALKAFMVHRLFRSPTIIHDEPTWVRVFVNGFYLLFTAHTCACSWIWIANASEREVPDVDASDKLVQEYLASMYWSLATLTSTGYGDISASETDGARALSLFWMCFGVLVIIYIGAKLTDFMVVTDPIALAEIDKKRKLSAFLSKNNIPWNVQKAALRVFPVVLEMTCQDNTSIIEELPQFLQEEIRVHVKQKLISRVALFRGLSDEVMRALVQVTVSEEYQVELCIIQYGEPALEMYFLEHGLVEVFTYDEKGKEQWIANLKSGSHFGESALMSTESRRTATVRAVTKCSVYALPKESFDYIAELYEELAHTVREERKTRLKEQGMFGATMFRKSVALKLFCTPRPTDSRAKVRWKNAMRYVLEGRYNRMMEDAEAAQMARNSRPTAITTRRQSVIDVGTGAMEGTFFERIDATPDPESLIRTGSMRSQGSRAGMPPMHAGRRPSLCPLPPG